MKKNIVDEFVDQLPPNALPHLNHEFLAAVREHVDEEVIFEVEGFQSEREFCRYVCKQIIGIFKRVTARRC